MIKLVQDTIDYSDIEYLISWLKTNPRLTKGPITQQFEKEWASFQGVGYTTYVNSGSSAILLMLYALIVAKKIKPGDKIIVPAISWATDLAPVIQLGLVPILCDCNLDDLSVDLDALEKLCADEKPSALILVSVLGLVPKMDSIVDICQKYNVVLLEDVCESLYSQHKGKQLGNFGLMSCFSLYFGHHISTIEGGIISTNCDEMNCILKSIRNHGWDRDLNTNKQKALRKEHNVSDFDALYTFYYPGFNVRATDLQAYLGLKQLGKIKPYSEKREENYKHYQKSLPDSFWKPVYRKNTFISSFCYPIIHEKRDKIVANLLKNNVECRPLICGTMGRQPMYVSRYGVKKLKNADYVSKYGFYIPNHQNLTFKNIDNIVNIITETI